MRWELTEWEYSELTEYFESRERFWERGDGETWFRMNPPNEFGHYENHLDRSESPSFALQVSIPPSGRFKVVTLSATPVNWTAEAVETHITELLFKTTNMPFRLDVASFLEKELGHPQELASRAAVIISRLQWGPLETELLNVPSPSSPLGTYHVVEGGVFSFQHRAGMLGIRMQLNRPTYGGFSTLSLEGHMRAVNDSRTQNIVDWLSGAKEERDMQAVMQAHRRIQAERKIEVHETQLEMPEEAL